MFINEVHINDYERVDDLHRNGFLIIQNPKRFCFGIDAVILSSFCKVKKGETALDLGTGTGILPILLAAKTSGKNFTGLEIQQEDAEMAARSVLLNNLPHKITIRCGDIKEAVKIYGNSAFDVVCTNPPYIKSCDGLTNKFSPKAVARHEVLCTLDDIIKTSAKLLRYGGRFYMVHKPQRLSDILCTLRKYKLEAKILRFVHAYANKPPMLMLVEAVMGGNPGNLIMPPLVVYNDTGTYTTEMELIYYG